MDCPGGERPARPRGRSERQGCRRLLDAAAPLYQLAGIAALLGLVLLVATSSGSARRRLWKSHRNFQATHIALGCALMVLVGAHVLAAGRYTGGYGRRALYLAVAAGGMGLLLQRRRGAEPARREFSLRGLAFGRHSRLVAVVLGAAMLALAPMIARRVSVALREPLIGRQRQLPLNFDHGKHVAVNCLACHHNYADARGFDACIHCHRGPRADLVVGVEARFHDFCLDCHRHPDVRLRHHGPVSGCAACHEPGAKSGFAPAESGLYSLPWRILAANAIMTRGPAAGP